MNQSTYNEFKDYIYQACGIDLKPGKQTLLSTRISKRMSTLGIAEPGAYLQYIRQDRSGKETSLLLDAISTNVTHFFRENDHFKFMRNVLHEWHSRGQTRFRFWSSACSSGEEPYSMAITACEAFAGCNVNTRILATDICRQVLEHAMRGKYEKTKMEPVPLPMLSRYFNGCGNNGTSIYGIKRPIREMIVFRHVNLSRPPFTVRGNLDMVFCRNVMIYFDHAVRFRLVAEFYRVLKPGGFLLVGHSESLNGIDHDFDYVQPAVYCKSG